VLKVQALVTSLIILALKGGMKLTSFLFLQIVTVRNDYTDSILEDSPLNGTYYEYVSLTAYLYNQQGRVDAVDVTYPINRNWGGHWFSVKPGETHSVTVYLATECKDVKRYEIYVNYVEPFPPSV
jgi:hypothetical protein